MSESRCSACGAAVAADEGFRLADPEADRHAVFCRLEHVVPWAERGGAWRPGVGLDDEDDDGEGLGRCAHCGDGLGHGHVLLVRHHGPFRIADALCGIEHLTAWAQGGRWRVG